MRWSITIALLIMLNYGKSQDFYEVFYFEDQGFQDTGGYLGWSGHLGYAEGVLGNIPENDSLAYIKFSGFSVGCNAYIACRYQFNVDTLIMKEIAAPVILDKSIEYFTNASYTPTDSLYINFQEYFEGTGGWTLYDSLTFSVEGIHFKNKGLYQKESLCDSYCNYVRRPQTSDFDISIWDGTKKLETFSLTLPEHCQGVRLTRDIFESRGSAFLCNSIVNRIPDKIEINGKNYFLKTEFIAPYDYQFFADPKPTTK